MKNPLTNKAGKVRELNEDDFKTMKSAKEVLPAQLLNVLPKRKRGERGIQKTFKKILTTIRYSPEVVSYFKHTGKGWQTEMDRVLKEYVKKHPADLKRVQSEKHSKR
jgi:uncharacterized protein (DUF4415 family)